MKRTLTITAAAPDSSDVKYNVAYVSNTATKAQLMEFASALNGLTNNSLVSVDLTTVEDITDED